mmetsp:Transcript_1889/g.2618  ORF Transcript_1889/g.2618 Transcript_1889/m.2618 type:complete len:88 (-) Transcript_1889:936-1199(-)
MHSSIGFSSVPLAFIGVHIPEYLRWIRDGSNLFLLLSFRFGHNISADDDSLDPHCYDAGTSAVLGACDSSMLLYLNASEWTTPHPFH